MRQLMRQVDMGCPIHQQVSNQNNEKIPPKIHLIGYGIKIERLLQVVIFFFLLLLVGSTSKFQLEAKSTFVLLEPALASATYLRSRRRPRKQVRSALVFIWFCYSYFPGLNHVVCSLLLSCAYPSLPSSRLVMIESIDEFRQKADF